MKNQSLTLKRLRNAPSTSLIVPAIQKRELREHKTMTTPVLSTAKSSRQEISLAQTLTNETLKTGIAIRTTGDKNAPLKIIHTTAGAGSRIIKETTGPASQTQTTPEIATATTGPGEGDLPRVQADL